MFRLSAASFLVLAVSACQSTASSNSVVADGGSSPVSSGPAGEDAATPNPSPPADNTACVAKIAYDRRCSDTAEMKGDACVQARTADCGTATLAMSDAYRAAVVACYTASLACGDDDTCITGKLIGLAPTAAQTKVRDDYCTTCGAEAGPNCKDDFFALSNENGNGDGYLILQVSDDLARKIDQECTGAALDIANSGADDCRGAFLSCASGDQQQAAPLPDVCYPQSSDPGDGGDETSDASAE